MTVPRRGDDCSGVRIAPAGKGRLSDDRKRTFTAEDAESAETMTPQQKPLSCNQETEGW